MSISPKDRRTIFGLCRELGLDDEQRQAIQKEVTGKLSTTMMTPLEAGQLIKHLRGRLGPRTRKPKRAGRVPANLDRQPMLAKIEALLADMGLSWEYAEGIAWRITGGKGEKPESQPGVKRMEWVRSERDFKAIIAALHVEHQKRVHCEWINEELKRIGRDEKWLEEQLPEGWAGKWQRHRGRQKSILEWLATQ